MSESSNAAHGGAATKIPARPFAGGLTQSQAIKALAVRRKRLESALEVVGMLEKDSFNEGQILALHLALQNQLDFQYDRIGESVLIELFAICSTVDFTTRPLPHGACVQIDYYRGLVALVDKPEVPRHYGNLEANALLIERRVEERLTEVSTLPVLVDEQEIAAAKAYKADRELREAEERQARNAIVDAGLLNPDLVTKFDDIDWQETRAEQAHVARAMGLLLAWLLDHDLLSVGAVGLAAEDIESLRMRKTTGDKFVTDKLDGTLCSDLVKPEARVFCGSLYLSANIEDWYNRTEPVKGVKFWEAYETWKMWVNQKWETYQSQSG
jgi:hypothetical protein